MPFQLVVSGETGEPTAHQISTLLHGRTVAKFTTEVDRHENHTATITFSNGDLLELYNVPPHRCRVTFRKKSA